MNALLDYRDPLMGLFILTAIIFVVSVFTLWYTLLKSRHEQKSIYRLLDRFSDDEKRPDNLILAKCYQKSGDYINSNKLYFELLKENQKVPSVLKEIATNYMRAGLLQRAIDILMQVIKHNSRDSEALLKLLYLYEKLYDYNKALDVARALDRMQESHKQTTYVQTLQAIAQKQPQRVLALYQEHGLYASLIFDYLLKIDVGYLDKLAHRDRCALIDTLYNLPKERLIESKHELLQVISSAKGYSQSAHESDIFELNVMIRAKMPMRLRFTYRCKSCQYLAYSKFYRCPNCLESAPCLVKMKLKELNSENN